MKKILYSIAAMTLLLGVSSCGKVHECKCVNADGTAAPNELNILSVDGGINCEDITEFAYERHTTIDGVQTLEHVEVHKVNCRDYGE